MLRKYAGICVMQLVLLAGTLGSHCSRPPPAPTPPTVDAGAGDASAQDSPWENPFEDQISPAIDGGPDAALDAGSVDAGPQDECARAEAKLAELNCQRKDGGPLWLTPVSETHFATECRRARADTPPRDWRPDCIAKVTKCENVDVAKRTAKGKPCPSSL